jgi:hypothetical protein
MLIARRTFQTAILVRNYSHGPTVGQVYQDYRKIDQLLGRLRPDLMTEKEQIEKLLSQSEITPTMAAYFKKEIDVSNEAKSTIHSTMVRAFV